MNESSHWGCRAPQTLVTVDGQTPALPFFSGIYHNSHSLGSLGSCRILSINRIKGIASLLEERSLFGAPAQRSKGTPPPKLLLLVRAVHATESQKSRLEPGPAADPSCPTARTPRAQYPLIKEYSLNRNMKPYIS